MCQGHLVFVNTKVYLTKVLFDNKFFPKYSMRGYGNDIVTNCYN